MTSTVVAIIGAGPVGLTAAMALSRHGIKPIVFERHDQIVNHPRGHVINVRSMEIFRSWGLDTAVSRHALDPATKRRISWATSLVGEELGLLETPAMPDDVSPAQDVSCPQDRVEEVLLGALRDEGVDVRYGTEVSVSSSSVGQRTVLRTNDGERIEARYVIAADGASSPTRRRFGIDMQGPPLLGHQVNIYFEADMADLLGDRNALLTWILNPVAPGVFINMGEKRRWVFNAGYDPNETPQETFSQRFCEELLREAIGVDIKPAVQTVRFWRMAAQVSDAYRFDDTFLCGDAAHRFPPTGGLGANTGIADAHNLAWKLAHVHRGTAEPALLDSYETERRPIAVANWSLRNSKNITETGVGPAATRNAEILAGGGASADALRDRIRDAIDRQVEHFDHLGQDLGYIYEPSSIVIDDGAPLPRSDGSTYVATTHPGARLPHVNLSDGRSTLDLVGSTYRLLVGCGGRAPAAAQTTVEHTELDQDAWKKLPQSEHVTGVLVRPDGHVATRFRDLGSQELAAIESIVRCSQSKR